MSKAPRDKMLRVDQAAEILNVSKKTIYRLSGEGQFICAKIRGGLRISEASLWAYMERQKVLFALEHGILKESGSDVDTNTQDSLISGADFQKIEKKR